MSSLEWRREQPRVEPPPCIDWSWITVTSIYAWIMVMLFTATGGWLYLVNALVLARWGTAPGWMYHHPNRRTRR